MPGREQVRLDYDGRAFDARYVGKLRAEVEPAAGDSDIEMAGGRGLDPDERFPGFRVTSGISAKTGAVFQAWMSAARMGTFCRVPALKGRYGPASGLVTRVGWDEP